MGRRILIALILGLLAWAYVHFGEERDARAPASTLKPAADLSSTPATPRPAQQTESVAKPDPPEPRKKPQYDRAQIERHLNQAPKSNIQVTPSGLPELNLVSTLFAIAQKQYLPAMGSEMQRQSGYVLVRTDRAAPSLENFDGVHLPVVQHPGRAALGVVTGEIEVVFHEVPKDLVSFARAQNLEIVADLPQIKTAFFAPRSYPAHLPGLAAQLRGIANVKNVEVSVIFGSRRRQ